MKNLRKSLSAITALGLTTVSAVNVVACGNNQPKPKPPSKKTDINEIIKTTDLGSITMAQATPSAVELLQAIKAKNPNSKDLTINDFTFKQGSPGTTSATIVGQGQYQGEVTLSYSKEKTDLGSIIKTTDLGSIYVGQLNIPNKEQLLIAIKAKNPEAKDLTINDFTFKQGSPGTTSATIVGKEQYQGEVSLTFTIKNFKLINGTSHKILSKLLSLVNDYVGNVYAGNNKGIVYKSNGTGDFTAMTGTSGAIRGLTTFDKSGGNIYAGSDNGTVYKSNGKDAFIAMKGTIGAIYGLSVDKDGNVYAGSTNGIVYKSNGTGDFTAMTGTSGEIYSLSVDKDGNVYAGNNKGIVYKSNGKDAFIAMTGISGEIDSLAVDKDGNVYAGNNKGIVYKSNGTGNFTAMTGTSGEIEGLAVDKDGNVYAGSDNGIVYKSNGKDAFTAMTGTSGEIYSLAIDKDGNVYAGSTNGKIFKSEFKLNKLTKIN